MSNVNGQEVLYYSQGFEERKNYALHLSTGKVEKSNFEIHPEGKPFENGNGVKVYENSSPQMATLIPNVDYSNLDLEKDADKYTVLDIEQCDNWIYYKIEANQRNPAADIGWRTGYSREKTAIVRRELDGDKVQVLYRY